MLVATNQTDVVARYWGRYQQWAALSRHLKRKITWWRTASLLLACAGALLQTTAAAVGHAGAPLAVVGTVALVLVPIIARYFLTSEQVRDWLRARSVAEGLKSLVYRFAARAAPFADDDRVARLSDAGKQAESWVESLAVELASIQVPVSVPPGPFTPETYVERRVRDQIDGYYRVQARRNARLALRFRRLEIATAVTAATLGATATGLQIASVGGGGIGAWVAVITTIGGALAAHAAASRYEQQARVYFATARQLEDLLDDWSAGGSQRDPVSWSTFVTACEQAISAENRGWMAKLDPEEQRADPRGSGAAVVGLAGKASGAL